MKIEDGPAAVTGITTCTMPLTFISSSVGKAQGIPIRKSEDLPEYYMVSAVVDMRYSTDLADTKGNPQV